MCPYQAMNVSGHALECQECRFCFFLRFCFIGFWIWSDSVVFFTFHFYLHWNMLSFTTDTTIRGDGFGILCNLCKLYVVYGSPWSKLNCLGIFFSTNRLSGIRFELFITWYLLEWFTYQITSRGAAVAGMLWVRITIRLRCTTLCDNVCQWLTTSWWVSSVSE